MSRLGPALVAAGIFIAGLGLLQHFLLSVGIIHLAIYLGILGLIVFAVGAWLMLGGRRTPSK